MSEESPLGYIFLGDMDDPHHASLVNKLKQFWCSVHLIVLV